MSSAEMAHVDGNRPAGTLARWKVAGAIASGIAMIPVAGLVLVFTVLFSLPVVPFLVPLLLAFHDRPPPRPSTPVMPRPQHGRHPALRKLAVMTVLLGVGACDRADTSRTPPVDRTTPVGGVAAPGAATSPEAPPGAGASGETIAAEDIASLDDGGRGAVLLAIDERIAKEAELAGTNASADGVKRVAHQLIVLHRDQMSNERDIFARHQINTHESAVSRRIEADTENALGIMRALTGPALDGYFLDEQVRAHKQAVDVVDRMFPGVQNADLAAEMLRDRPALTLYLTTLTDLQRGTGVAEKQGTGGPSRPLY